jgi:hypothetical protein
MKIVKIEACKFEDNLFDDTSIIVDCTLDLEDEYKIKTIIDNDCIDYFFINIVIAQKVCDSLRIILLKLNKFREMKSYDERRSKNIIHVIYSFMIIQNHTKILIFMMIIKLDQHWIILEKSWMKKHDVNYHEHDDSISFYLDYCSHLEAFNYSYSNRSNRIQTKKKDSFSKEIFSDQSEIIENKEIKIFLEKNNNSKMILKKSTIIDFSERLIERSQRLIESQRKTNERRRIDEFWEKN